MKKIRKIYRAEYLIAGIIIIVLAACGKSSYHKISDDESLWMTYNDGDERYFLYSDSTLMSDSSQIDTIYFYGKTKAYKEEGDNYEEYMQIKFRIKNDTIPMNREGTLRLEKSGNGFTVSLKFPHHPADIVPFALPVIPFLNINSTIYSNVYVSTANPLFLNQFMRIERVWYNREYGILKYSDITGNQWELIP